MIQSQKHLRNINKTLSSIVLIFILSCDNISNVQTSEGILETGYSGDTLVNTMYYQSGELKWKSFMLDSQFVGEQVEYYKSGNIKSRVNYKEGVLHGLKTSYYENGQILTELTYRDGIKSGKYSEYYKDGKVKYLGKVDSLFTGDYYEYNDDGEINLYVKRINGKDYEYTVYDENGSVQDSGDILLTEADFSIRTESDTVRIDDESVIEFVVAGKMVNSGAFIKIGELDTTNRLVETVGKIPVNERIISIAMSTKTQGQKELEGIVEYDNKAVPFRVSVEVIE